MQDEQNPQQDEDVESSEEEVEGHLHRPGSPEDPSVRMRSDDDADDEVEGHLHRPG